ncbi:MAG: sulfotransferase [Pseudomonadota bacterium]|nr:sulfotransferase [Pseudomonadota bacterium]
MNRSTDKHWTRVYRYLAMRQLAPARAELECILARQPTSGAAHLMLGGLLADADHQQAAAGHVLEAARNPPADPGVLGDLIAALIRVGEIVAARRLLDHPSITTSASAPILLRAATQLQTLGEHRAALGLIERARDAGADGRVFHFSRAIQLLFNGRLDEAEADLERSVAIEPPLGQAYLHLARARRQTPARNHLQAITRALANVEPGGEDQAALEFARYKELEDLQRYDEAWHALERGNALLHAQLPCDSARESALFERLIEVCTPEFLHPGSARIDDGPRPIFVIGMPRSGTTVLERVLCNHSQVESAGELGEFPRALAWATDHAAPVMLDATTLARLPQVDWTEVGRRYLAQTRWRARGNGFYVDKLPRNWMLAGLIHRALPNARIIRVVRDPMDVCFSNWRACFGVGAEYAYAYDLAALAAHFGQYQRVLAHWQRALPGVILDVDYARLVQEPETAARDILAFCGLDYEPGCVDLTRNAAPVATLSAPQVRQPIHARSFREWEPYGAQLQGLASALASAPEDAAR